MEEKQLNFNDYVRLQIDAGVAPLEPVFYPIVRVDGVDAIAFRSSTVIHSIIMGVMKEVDYTMVSDKRLCGIELLKHNVQHAIATIKTFDKANKRCDFIAVRCPAQLVEKTSIAEVVKEVLQKNPSVDPQRICVEFTEDLVEHEGEKIKFAILDLKLLHVRTALVGVGKEEFKVSKLLSAPVDFAIIDKSASEWAGNRNKPQLFNSLLGYIKSMGVDSIAIGNEEEKKEMHFSDAVGFMFEGIEPISLESALTVAEEAEI